MQKVLTSGNECGIISKSPRKSGGERSLKIEQQERSTKLKNSMCIGSRTIQREYYSTKVKLLRAKLDVNRVDWWDFGSAILIQ